MDDIKDIGRDRRDSMLTIPKFLIGVRDFTSAQIGTFTHLVLERADFTRDSNPDKLEELICRLVENETLLPEQAAAVDRRAILNFFKTEAGRLASRADKLNRETLFTVKLPLNEYAGLTNITIPDGPALSDACAPAGSIGSAGQSPPSGIRGVAGADAEAPLNPLDPNSSQEMPFVLMQGSIDCWFTTPEGIVLIDYKTGYSARKDISEERLRKYKLQIELYTLALKKITGKNVHRKFICLLSAGRCIEII
jgi:ATP-dependent helicase/nuclease subunit A